MEKLQTTSWAAFMLFVGAIVFGFRDMQEPFLDIASKYYLYAAFLLVLRFKFALDDHYYFGITLMKRWQARTGLAIGVVSWFCFIFSAYSLKELPESYLLFLTAIGTSTLWIVVVAIREGFYPEQLIWVGTNATYMMGTGFLLWEEQTNWTSSIGFINEIVRNEYTPIVVISLMLIVVMFDFARGKSMDHAKD